MNLAVDAEKREIEVLGLIRLLSGGCSDRLGTNEQNFVHHHTQLCGHGIEEETPLLTPLNGMLFLERKSHRFEEEGTVVLAVGMVLGIHRLERTTRLRAERRCTQIVTRTKVRRPLPDPSTIYTLATKTAGHDARATRAPSASTGPPPVIDHVSRDHNHNQKLVGGFG